MTPIQPQSITSPAVRYIPEMELWDQMDRPLDGTVLRKVFLLLMRLHYSDPEHYGDFKDAIGGFVYADEEDKRTLDIDLSFAFDREKAYVRPSIFVGFNTGFKLNKLVVDNDGGNSADMSRTTEVARMDTGLSIIHIAPDAEAVGSMSLMTSLFLMGIRQSLMCKLRLQSFDGTGITETKLISKAPLRYFVAETQFSMSYINALHVNLESHRIKKFALQMSASE